MFKNWGDRDTTLIDPVFENNPELGCEIILIKLFLILKGYDELIYNQSKSNERGGIVKIFWDKYKLRFTQKYLCPRVIRQGGIFPQMGKTAAIAEFLRRGFKHEDEAKINYQKWYIKSSIAPLVWHEDFEDQPSAINLLNKQGIPGYTGVHTLKKR